MALAMLGSLDVPSLQASHGPHYAWGQGWRFIRSFSWPLLCLGAWMTLHLELLMALATLGCLDGPSLEASHGPSSEASHGPHYALGLGCCFVGSFSWPLLCLGAWMALLWELLMALAMLLGSLYGPSLGTSHGPCYAAWEIGWPFVGSFS